MPRRYTLLELVTRAQRRCDREGDDTISTPEWKALISEQYGDLYSVVAEAGLRYFETTNTITTTGVASYDEPVDHLGTVSVCRVINTAGARRDLKEIMAQERSYWTGMTGEATRYALVDDQIYLYPTPPAGQTYEMLYIPQPPDLSLYADTDVIDVVTPDGEAFLLWGVAALVAAKTQDDDRSRLALSRQDATRVRLSEWATMRAFNSPRHRVIEDDEDDPRNADARDWRMR